MLPALFNNIWHSTRETEYLKFFGKAIFSTRVIGRFQTLSMTKESLKTLWCTWRSHCDHTMCLPDQSSASIAISLWCILEMSEFLSCSSVRTTQQGSITAGSALIDKSACVVTHNSMAQPEVISTQQLPCADGK